MKELVIMKDEAMTTGGERERVDPGTSYISGREVTRLTNKMIIPETVEIVKWTTGGKKEAVQGIRVILH